VRLRLKWEEKKKDERKKKKKDRVKIGDKERPVKKLRKQHRLALGLAHPQAAFWKQPFSLVVTST